MNALFLSTEKDIFSYIHLNNRLCTVAFGNLLSRLSSDLFRTLRVLVSTLYLSYREPYSTSRSGKERDLSERSTDPLKAALSKIPATVEPNEFIRWSRSED